MYIMPSRAATFKPSGPSAHPDEDSYLYDMDDNGNMVKYASVAEKKKAEDYSVSKAVEEHKTMVRVCNGITCMSITLAALAAAAAAVGYTLTEITGGKNKTKRKKRKNKKPRTKSRRSYP